MTCYKHKTLRNQALIHFNMKNGEFVDKLDELHYNGMKAVAKAFGKTLRLRYRGPHKNERQTHTLKRHAYGAAVYYRG